MLIMNIRSFNIFKMSRPSPSPTAFYVVILVILQAQLVLLLPSSQPKYDRSIGPRLKNPCTRLTDVYDIERKRCVTKSTAGCPENMELRVMPNNGSFGLCDCITFRPTFYDRATKRCRRLYRQEYCRSGQWLISSGSGRHSGVVCAANNCEKIRSSRNDEIVLYRGQCVKIGYSSPYCRKGQVLLFLTGKFEPICAGGGFDGGGGLAGSVPKLLCSRGTKWSYLTGDCQRAFDYNLADWRD